jgi:hypothetical protein
MGKLGEKMSTIQTKFIVVSLPRTGTLSMCQMLTSLGFTCEHPVGPSWKAFLGRFNRNVLADTPMFAPSTIQYVLDRSNEVKFIYINKNPQDWVASMVKVGLKRAHNSYYNTPDWDSFAPHAAIDFKSLNEVLDGVFAEDNACEKFEEHKLFVKGTIPPERLLTYHFSEGWEPLCEFVGKPVSNIEVPHLNINTMFDKITT